MKTRTGEEGISRLARLMSDVSTSIGSAGERRRWLVLAVIGIAQLMVVLDGSVRVHISTAEASDRL